MTEREVGPRTFGQSVKAILSLLRRTGAGGGPEGARPGMPAEQLVVICLVGGVILVIAVILLSALLTGRPG